CPPARVVSIEGDSNLAARWHEDGVTNSAMYRAPVYRDYLEDMTVKMHRMRHHRAVDQLNLDALTFVQHQRCDVRPVLPVHRPRIGLHCPAENDGVDGI